MGQKRLLMFVRASGCVCAIVASSVTFASFKSGKTSDVTLAQDMAEIEKFHRRDVAATVSRDTKALTELSIAAPVCVICG